MIGITALDKNGGIGYKNKLPWPSIKEDFKFFKELTWNKSIIVGNNTFKDLPPLKERYIKVLTNDKDKLYDRKFQNGEYFNLAQFTKEQFDNWTEKDIVCGGAQIYKMFLPNCSSIYITHVDGEYLCDTYFPFSLEEIKQMFPKSQSVKEFSGAKIIQYHK